MSLVGITEGEMLPKLGPNDNLATPSWLWGLVVAHLGEIALDPCANPKSSVIARDYCYGPHEGGTDGLAVEWPVDGPVWVNCPYGPGHMPLWMAKCRAEAERGCEIVALAKCAPSAGWWRRSLGSVRAIAYLNRRVRFDGGGHGSGKFESACLYWGPRPHLFLHAFAGVADGRFVR